MRQSLRVYGDGSFDPTDFFTHIVALGFCDIGIFDTLSINNQKGGRRGSSPVDSFLRKPIFLRPAAGCFFAFLPSPLSTWKSSRKQFSILGILWAGNASDSLFSKHKEHRWRLPTNPRFWALSAFWPIQGVPESAQIVHVLCHWDTVVQIYKSITAREIFRREPCLCKELWGGEFWTDGYYVGTVGERGELVGCWAVRIEPRSLSDLGKILNQSQ